MGPFSSCGTGFSFPLNETDFMKWVSKIKRINGVFKLPTSYWIIKCIMKEGNYDGGS